MLVGVAVVASGSAHACECRFLGPFAVVAADAPAVVRGVVRAHEGTSRVGPSRMRVEVQEVLKGDLVTGPMVVHGGDGMLCRPEVAQFAVGGEWVLALNGPGSKPGVEGGWAVSNCGAFFLRVEGERVFGNFDDDLEDGTVQEVSLGEVRAAIRDSPPPRVQESFTFELAAGERLVQPFGQRFALDLAPTRDGWFVTVSEAGREEDPARLTPPFHFVPNPRELEGWHFHHGQRGSLDGTAEEHVNAPGEVRRFIFSPEVGVTVGTRGAITPEEVRCVERYGKGRLAVTALRLGDADADGRPPIAWMRCLLQISYPKPAAP